MSPVRRLELRRHAHKGTDLGGDCLSPEGVEQALALGQSLTAEYTHLFSSGAQRATQTLACILAGLGRRVSHGVTVRPGLVSPREPGWREAARTAGTLDLQRLATSHSALVAEESRRLGAEVRSILTSLPEGAYALAIGHTPLIECAVLDLTGTAPTPLRELDGFIFVDRGAHLEVDTLI